MKLHFLSCLGERKEKFLQSILNTILCSFLLNQKVNLLHKCHSRLCPQRIFCFIRVLQSTLGTEAKKNRSCAGANRVHRAQHRQRTRTGILMISIWAVVPLKNPQIWLPTSADRKPTPGRALSQGLQARGRRTRPDVSHQLTCSRRWDVHGPYFGARPSYYLPEQRPLGCTGCELRQRSAGEELSREALQGAVHPPTWCSNTEHQPARSSFPLGAAALALCTLH